MRRFRARYEDGRIDVGLGRIEGEDAAIRRIMLCEEGLVVAMSPAHPLAGSSVPFMLRDLHAERLIVYPKAPRPSCADQVMAIVGQHGLQPSKAL